MAEPQGSIKLTAVRELLTTAALGALTGWVVVKVLQLLDWQQPQLPWGGLVVLFFIAAILGALARGTWVRLQVRRERMEPERAVSLLVLGKSAALGGAFLGAAYLAFGLSFVDRIDAPAPRGRVIGSAVAFLACLGITIAGLFLERACKAPEPPDEERGETPENPQGRAG